MSNNVYLKPTKFTDLRTGDSDVGFMLWDNYGEWSDFLDEVPDCDAEFFKLVFRSDYIPDVADGILDTAREKGIIIGGQHYSSDWVREQFDKR